MYVLGINSAYHESSACLLRDGEIVAAVEEERFSRTKHGKLAAIDNADELPIHAIRYCLQRAGIDGRQVDWVGFSLNPQGRLRNREIPDRVVEGSWGSATGEGRFFQTVSRVPERLRQLGIGSEIKWLPHHVCHAASAYFPSPFPEAAVLCVDGIGETASSLFAHGEGNRLRVLGDVDYPHSLGFLWEKLCKYLGFSEYDAYKVMGLAAYGKPVYVAQLRSLVQLAQEGKFLLDNNVLCFRVEDYAPLERLFGVPRREAAQPLTNFHQDLAASLQEITNEVMLHMVRHLHSLTKSRRLCLAGGVTLNCVSNRFVFEEGPFEELYVQPAAHDAGTALGAAQFIWHVLLEHGSRASGEHCYLGPSFTPEEMERALEKHGLRYERVGDIEERVARLLSEGHIVGWLQGAMEFGPRALGNRSLLADPRHPGMKQMLNERIKHRESFRPFAPSVLAEEARHWFQISKATTAAEFMLMTYPAWEHQRPKTPAVLHVDGTGRVQLVRRETNPRYHKLISAFFRLTGVPMVLNTSFNDNEPIVCAPRDAIETFKKTHFDYLALGDFLVDRSKQGGWMSVPPG